ncbi:MAG: flagellar basal body P-ring formation chaperone FlgA [Desulfobacteraceae bacterium]|nr:flagellar basal body P-ring formation chaperone FlgA [Desulfobacteraceae bacterium]
MLCFPLKDRAAACRRFNPAAVCGVLLVLLLAVSHGGSCGASAGENKFAVQVAARATVSGETITLGDIAEITAAPEIRPQLAAIDLGRAPQPGQAKRLAGAWITARLNAQTRVPSAATVSIPAQVTVQRAAQRIAGDVLERFFTDYVARRLAGEDFRVSSFKVRGDDAFPVGAMALRPAEMSSAELVGQVSLPVAVVVDGRHCGRLIVSAWVSRPQEVVCLQRPVSRGAVLTAADLRLESRDLSRLTGQPILKLQAAEGMRARRSLRAGDYLKQAFLETPPLISKGDRIRMVATSGRLRVSAIGIARSEGGHGEQIQVENPASGKTVVGRVVDASTVAIRF